MTMHPARRRFLATVVDAVRKIQRHAGDIARLSD